MPSPRITSAAGALLRAAGLAAAVAAIAPAAARAADPEVFCVANTVAAPCPSAGVDKSFTTFAALKAYIDANGASSGAEVRVEPGTYAEQVVFDGPSDLVVHGDPAASARPVITSSTGPAVTLMQRSEGSTFTHLEIDHTGPAGTAFATVNEFQLHDVVLNSTGAAIVHSGSFGSDKLDNVVAASTAPGTSAAGIPLIQTSTSSTQTWTNLTVNAADRASGIVARNAGIATIDGLSSTAHGLVNGKGGYALAFIGFAPGGEDSRNPNVQLHHAKLFGGSFGLAGFSTQLHAFDVLATSDGAPPEPVKVGSDDPVANGGGALVDDPLPPAAVGSGAASNLTLLNVTAVAAGAGADGVVANSARGVDEGNGFDYAAFMSISNSIMRGPHADAEVLDGANPRSQQGYVATDHDNFVTAIGARNAITGGDTVTKDPTDQIDDPMFVNPIVGPGGDFHVKAGSRTLQSAGYIPPGETDLDGNPRPGPAGTAGDLGAYESTSAPSGPGTPPGGASHTTPPPTGTPGGGGGASPPPGKKVPPSNAFTLGASKVAKTGAITLALTAPGAGTFKLSASTTVTKRVKRGRRHVTKKVKVSFGSAAVSTAGPQAITATITPSHAVTPTLKKGTKLKVTVLVTFTPAGGAAASATRSVTVKRKT